MKKPLIRRTLSQERYEVLIKRQKNGSASFKDLTELDEIVNRDLVIREIVLEEMLVTDPPAEDQAKPDTRAMQTRATVSLLEKIKTFLNRLFLLCREAWVPLI